MLKHGANSNIITLIVIDLIFMITDFLNKSSIDPESKTIFLDRTRIYNAKMAIYCPQGSGTLGQQQPKCSQNIAKK